MHEHAKLASRRSSPSAAPAICRATDRSGGVGDHQFENVYATVGMHPHDAKDVGVDELEDRSGNWLRARKLLRSARPAWTIITITRRTKYSGEFSAQFIHMARETELPIVVHERDAAKQSEDLLCCEGAGETARCHSLLHRQLRSGVELILDLGFYLSFTGIITFKNAEPLREVVRKVPLERIFVETDSPYLTPVPSRGKRNKRRPTCASLPRPSLK